MTDAPAKKVKAKKKLNTYWRAGRVPRAGVRVVGNDGNEYTEPDFIQKFAREETGWYHGARVRP